MAAPDLIRQLVDRFPAPGSATFLALNEAEVRSEFVNPFFTALGWDVSNTSGTGKDFKEVILEDRIQVRHAQGRVNAPDYAFRLGGQRKFFVEAKKPSVNLKDDPRPAYQLKHYGWSATLPLGVVSDFQEFCVYDCRHEPIPTDKADIALERYIEYQDYEVQWDYIYGLFSKEAVTGGSLERYAEQADKRKNIRTVDMAFLKDMEMFRRVLAEDIARRNLKLEDRDLNHAVQMILNRILFLRVSEDRALEPYEQLKLLAGQDSIYDRLKLLFQDADDRYNSGLFHFREERGRSTATDELTQTLTVSDTTLQQVITQLYSQRRYNFEMMPVEIMGKVYEQFLGHTIELDNDRNVQVVEKPEVRKAGGVFYTPQYICEAIVNTILNDMLKDKSVKQVAALRIADIACGSGSFLITAYRYLLNWHRSQYVANVDKYKKLLYQDIYGDWQLSVAERRRILLNNIYGVDIDAQAVENAKITLLMMVLEGATKESLGFQLTFAHERPLPDLDTNIKCGNSLVDFRVLRSAILSEADKDIINALDWDDAFPDIMKAGGFDVLLGNPPYVRIQVMKEWAPAEAALYPIKYSTAGFGNYDKYALFVERGLELLNSHGRLGYILPHKFFNAQYGEALRNLIAKGHYLEKVVHFGHQQVFEGASTYTCLMFLNKAGGSDSFVTRVEDLVRWRVNGDEQSSITDNSTLTSAEWHFSDKREAAILGKISQHAVPLSVATSRIFQGVKTSADKIYILEEREHQVGMVRVYSRQTQKEYWLEDTLLHPLIKGGHSKPFSMSPSNLTILFPYEVRVGQKGSLIPASQLEQTCPATWAYLVENKEYLEEREHGKMHGPKWYGYIYPKALEVMTLPKLFTPDIAQKASFSLDATGETFFTGGVAGGYGILVSDDFSREYILALLNSRLLDWANQQVTTQMRGGYYSYEARYIRNLPIHVIDADSVRERAYHNQLVSLTKTVLTLNEKLLNELSTFGKTLAKRQIRATEQEINRLVYALYDLTTDDIAVVEGAESKPALSESFSQGSSQRL